MATPAPPKPRATPVSGTQPCVPASARPTAARRQPLLLFLTQQRSPVPPLITVQHRLINIINSKLLGSARPAVGGAVGAGPAVPRCSGRATGWALPLFARWDDLWRC